MPADALASWRDTKTRQAIVEFVDRVTAPGPDHVPPPARVAVFDNDGTLWVEKPVLVELGFILGRLAAMAEKTPELRDRQPWRAAYEQDHDWLGQVITRHYQGDDRDLRVVMGGVVAAFEGMTVDDHVAAAAAYLATARHPTLGRPCTDLAYRPMLELLRYLAAHGFTNYIASGGTRDFMRVTAEAMYGIPPERVIGSTLNALRYRAGGDGGAVVYAADPGVIDDGPVKPVQIWSRIGRRPVVAVGNSNGDVPMLRFAGGDRPALRLLVRHDDADREFAYTAGAEHALDEAARAGWTVVSVRDDWTSVFD